jgi:hypothetical protein
VYRFVYIRDVLNTSASLSSVVNSILHHRMIFLFWKVFLLAEKSFPFFESVDSSLKEQIRANTRDKIKD